jgi:hypothetical protein
MENKVKIIRASKFNSTNFQLAYMPLVKDGYIKSIVKRISSSFGIEVPISFRSGNIQTWVLNICTIMSKGHISGEMALRQCHLMAGTDKEARQSVLLIVRTNPDLYHALATSWGLEADPNICKGQRLSKDLPCIASQDCFHTPRLTHTKITNNCDAHELITKLANVTTLFINIRFINDPSRRIEDPGMVSLLPGGSNCAYHVFPFAENGINPEMIKGLFSTIASKKLITGKKRAVSGGFRDQRDYSN